METIAFLLRRFVVRERLHAVMIVLLSLPIVIGASPARAENGTSLTEVAPGFVEILTRNGIGALATTDQDRSERRAALSQTFYRSFATDAIAQIVLGRYWLSASAHDKTNFLSALGGYVADAVISNFSNGQFEIFSASIPENQPADGQRVEVLTVFVTESFSTTVVWSLDVDGDGLKVVDIIFGGRSFLLAQRSHFQRIMQRNGGSLAALIEEIES